MRFRATTRALCALAVVSATLTTSCSLLESEATVKQRQFATLMQRPDLDQAISHYGEMLTTIRTQLSMTFPRFSWSVRQQEGRAGCGADFDEVNRRLSAHDAQTAGLPTWASKGGFTDEEWARAVAIVGDIARRYGFDVPQLTVDRPGDHSIELSDRYKASFTFSSAVNTSLLLITGCHLTPEAKRRGVPASEATY
ncbi:LppA family lipoprotein [Pseudonocardia spinosispora]|uniref:LppA family lipoprotein n=1 Tax=Pseudonocardia spinosispora TaxID=103441 RepID=UPI0004161CC3|nr:LppA family lipoprotein [Pseudonocardia spinosispora]